jgi:hypothetical protein
MTSNQTSPVNWSGGFFTVGGFGWMCAVAFTVLVVVQHGSARCQSMVVLPDPQLMGSRGRGVHGYWAV